MKKEDPPKPKVPEITVQISVEEMKKKQAKKDEDPRITKFKNAEVNTKSDVSCASLILFNFFHSQFLKFINWRKS